MQKPAKEYWGAHAPKNHLRTRPAQIASQGAITTQHCLQRIPAQTITPCASQWAQMAPKVSGSTDEHRSETAVGTSLPYRLYASFSDQQRELSTSSHLQFVNTVMMTHCDDDPFKKCPLAFKSPPQDLQRLTKGSGAHTHKMVLVSNNLTSCLHDFVPLLQSLY